jgi:ribosomal protein S18 acetylase RimI-like enzyme
MSSFNILNQQENLKIEYISLKKLSKKDINELVRMENNLLRENRELLIQDFSPKFRNERYTKKDLYESIKKDKFYKLLLNDKIIGFCSYKTNVKEISRSIFINNIYIDKEYRQKGYGFYLLKQVMDIATQPSKNVKHIILSVVASNTNAVKLYRNLGFKDMSITMMIDV